MGSLLLLVSLLYHDITLKRITKGEIAPFLNKGWVEILGSYGVKDITTRTHKAESLSNPREDVKDLVQAFPRVVSSLVRRPRFREFIKVSATVPKNLLDYFGYGLYAGRI